jgi:condensin complex subunit 1
VLQAKLNFVASEDIYEMTLLERVSVQALCKFMCVSEDFCKENLDLVLSFVNEDTVPTDVKQTIICAVGDLMRLFTN